MLKTRNGSPSKKNGELLKDIAAQKEGIAFLNDELQFEYINDAYAHIYGYNSASDLIGESWGQLYNDEQIEFLKEKVLPQVSKSGDWQGEVVGRKLDGMPFSQNVSISRIEGKGFICVVQDMSNGKQRAQDISRASQDNKMLLKETHHRLKNNLEVLSGIIELEKDAPEAPQKLLQDVQSRIQTIAMIHEKLHQSESFEEIEMSDYLGDLVTLLESSFQCGNKDITVTSDIQKFNINSKKIVPLGLITNELLSNAFEHGFDGIKEGHIRISSQVEQGEMTFVIANDGKALPDNFSIHNEDSLGLSLVEALTHEIGGALRVTQDHWTTFEITFPVEETW